MKNLRLVLFLLLPLVSYGQHLNDEALQNQLSHKTDEEKVDYILDNFYKIYSVSFDRAIEATNYAQKLSSKNNWSDKEGYALMYNGIAHYLRGNYESAIDAFLKSSEIFEKINDLDGIARVNNEMSVFYRKTDNMKKAYAALNKAEKAAKAANNDEQLGTNYGMRGSILSLKGDIEAALPYFKKVLEIRLRQNDSVGLGYVFLDFAQYEFYKGRIDKSTEYIEKSMLIRKNIDDLQGVAINTQLIGKNYYHSGQYKKAIPYFKKANDLAAPIGYTDLIRADYDLLQKSYIELLDFKNAYKYLVENKRFQDSLFNTAKTKTIEELQTKYETEKKDQKILFLNQENELQNATNERNTIVIIALIVSVGLLIVIFYLSRQRLHNRQLGVLNEQKIRMREAQIKAVINSEEKERKRFAADLHDSMGQLISALNVNITSLRSLNGNREVRDEIFENTSNLLGDIQTEIRNIAFNLMPHVLTKEGLLPALRELTSRINKSHKVKARLQVFGIQERFNEVYEISLYRILQEWISNVLKYAEATELYIQFTDHEKEIIITVEDNGNGFDLNAFEQSKGNGYRNINTRLNLINAKMEVDTQQGRKNSMLTLAFFKESAFDRSRVTANTE